MGEFLFLVKSCFFRRKGDFIMISRQAADHSFPPVSCIRKSKKQKKAELQSEMWYIREEGVGEGGYSFDRNPLFGGPDREKRRLWCREKDTVFG
jgi:hypothetical protein